MGVRTETGYEIPDNVVEDIKESISRLSREEIDRLYKKAGFIVAGAEDDGNQALTDTQLDSIKSGKGAMIENLLKESSKDTVEFIVNYLDDVSAQDLR
jgi:hypothetical protein